MDQTQPAGEGEVDERPAEEPEAEGHEAQALQPDAEDATVRMRIPTDAWRVIIDFAAPAKVTRHLAARAETLDEFVRRELENKPDEWNDTLCVKHAVTHTRTRLDLLNTLRLVATEWRTLVDYDSESTRQLALPTDLHINFDSDDVRARFRNCEILTIDGDAHQLSDQSTATWVHLRRDRYDEFPDVLWHTRRLRSLSLFCIAPPSPLIRGDLPFDHLVELSIDYPLGEEKNYTDVWRAWESDPNALPRTLEVLNFGRTPDVSLECIRLLPRLRELRLGQRNQKRPDIVPGWFHGLRSLRRFEVHIAKPTDWAAQLCDLSLEAVSFSSDYLEEAEDQFLASLNVMANGALGSSLRKFKLDGYQDHLTRAPDVVSLFPNLQHLDLSGNFLIGTGLPEELGQLPLVVLDLSYTKVSTLPASLRGTKTLQLLYLLSTAWLSGPFEHGDDIVLQAGSLADPDPGLPYFSLAYAADEIARRDAILRPLSLALPDLRIRTHGDDVALANASMRWWHARCGWHWADPEFYYDTLGVRSD